MDGIIHQIAEELNRVGSFRVFEEADGKTCSLLLPVPGGPPCRVRFEDLGDGGVNDVAVSAEALAVLSDEPDMEMYRLINDFNSDYLYVTFSIDKRQRINLRYDYPKEDRDDAILRSVQEIVLRFDSIIRDVYPRLMRQIWAKPGKAGI